MSTRTFEGRLRVLLFSCLAAFPAAAREGGQSSEQQIKRQIIEESIASYPGRCPCPFNVTRNGSACGGRSAWSRRGGYAPICYEREVTREMVRERQKQERASKRQENNWASTAKASG